MQEARQFALRLYSQITRHLTLRNFHEIFEIGIYIYKKHDTFCYVTFYIQKSRHFEKSKKFCVTIFIYKNPDTLRNAIFHGFFEIGGGGGGDFYQQKTMHFAINFYMRKKCIFCYVFIFKNHTLHVTFLFAKNSALCVTFLNLKFIV